VIARFDANGQLDTTFGTSGVANLAFARPSQVAVQSDGKILVTSGADGAGAPVPSQQPGTIVRYKSNGTVDHTFGSGNRRLLAIGFGPPHTK
jgi:glucose/arabinose dehydrogenase